VLAFRPEAFVNRTSRLFAVLMIVVGMTGAMSASIASLQTPAPAAKAVDITGKWTASFDTPVGVQNYTYDFVAKDGKLTGKVKNSMVDAPADITAGKVEGDTVSFAENLNFQGMEIPVTYTGKIVSADEIKFTRQVGEFATEEAVAKRVKDAK
jgi:hypothetical protein